MPSVKTPAPPRWAPLKTASVHFECSEKTLRRMIARGEITGYRFGPRMLRVDLVEVEAALRPVPAVAS